jgi:hypothetical protein
MPSLGLKPIATVTKPPTTRRALRISLACSGIMSIFTNSVTNRDIDRGIKRINSTLHINLIIFFFDFFITISFVT